MEANRLQTRSWTDRDGNKHITVEIVAESVYFADSKPVSSPEAENAPAKGSKKKAA